MAEFGKGDIVRNIFAGKSNPTAYLLYLGKGTCKQGRYIHKVYNCLGYDGKKVQVFRSDNPLVLVGHMDEFDTFMTALKSLADLNNTEKDD
jgi:hypothetical protein